MSPFGILMCDNLMIPHETLSFIFFYSTVQYVLYSYTALSLYLQSELTQREKYAILIIEDLFQGEVQFLTGGEKHWLQVRAPAIVSKAEWVGIPYQRYSPDERNKIRLYSRVYFAALNFVQGFFPVRFS